jgi:hypothetical protein
MNSRPPNHLDSKPEEPTYRDVSIVGESRRPQMFWFTPEQAARVWRAIDQWPEMREATEDRPPTAG